MLNESSPYPCPKAGTCNEAKRGHRRHSGMMKWVIIIGVAVALFFIVRKFSNG